MRTVESLITELQKFPPQAKCYAYEGEVIGIVINPPSRNPGDTQGVIFCAEGDGEEKETITLDQEAQ